MGRLQKRPGCKEVLKMRENAALSIWESFVDCIIKQRNDAEFVCARVKWLVAGIKKTCDLNDEDVQNAFTIISDTIDKVHTMLRDGQHMSDFILTTHAKKFGKRLRSAREYLEAKEEACNLTPDNSTPRNPAPCKVSHVGKIAFVQYRIWFQRPFGQRIEWRETYPPCGTFSRGESDEGLPEGLPDDRSVFCWIAEANYFCKKFIVEADLEYRDVNDVLRRFDELRWFDKLQNNSANDPSNNVTDTDVDSDSELQRKIAEFWEHRDDPLDFLNEPDVKGLLLDEMTRIYH